MLGLGLNLGLEWWSRVVWQGCCGRLGYRWEGEGDGVMVTMAWTMALGCHNVDPG